jgi:hypothetical protein
MARPPQEIRHQRREAKIWNQIHVTKCFFGQKHLKFRYFMLLIHWLIEEQIKPFNSEQYKLVDTIS